MASGAGVNRPQVARELGIDPALLGRWYREFEKEGKAAFKGHGKVRDEEMAALKRELVRVRSLFQGSRREKEAGCKTKSLKSLMSTKSNSCF